MFYRHFLYDIFPVSLALSPDIEPVFQAPKRRNEPLRGRKSDEWIITALASILEIFILLTCLHSTCYSMSFDPNLSRGIIPLARFKNRVLKCKVWQ
ncbi:MAG: hypothetical protein ACFFD4_15320 [Candidatus Odinarchaeota archaeon]